MIWLAVTGDSDACHIHNLQHQPGDRVVYHIWVSLTNHKVSTSRLNSNFRKSYSISATKKPHFRPSARRELALNTLLNTPICTSAHLPSHSQPKPNPSFASWIARSNLSCNCPFEVYSGRSNWLKLHKYNVQRP